MVNSIRKIVPQPVRALLKRVVFRYRNRNFRPHVAHFERYGRSFRFYVGDRIGESWFRGGWDWAEIDHLCNNLVKPGDVVFECGAHHGEVTILLSHRVGPGGRVVAFEPVPRNVEIIRRQIELNDLTNVELIAAAVGRKSGRVRMTDESNAQVASRGSGVDVPVVCLDDYEHLRPTLLKVDVEGYEGELLKGAQRVLATRPRLSIEIHTQALSRYDTSVDEIMTLVEQEAYDWSWQYSGASTVSPWRGEPIEQTAHLFGHPVDR